MPVNGTTPEYLESRSNGHVSLSCAFCPNCSNCFYRVMEVIPMADLSFSSLALWLL